VRVKFAVLLLKSVQSLTAAMKTDLKISSERLKPGLVQFLWTTGGRGGCVLFCFFFLWKLRM